MTHRHRGEVRQLPPRRPHRQPPRLRRDAARRPARDGPAGRPGRAPIAVLRRAVELGVDHIDTSDYYGPHVDQRADPRGAAPLSRRAGRSSPRSAPAGRPRATGRRRCSPDELRRAVQDNLDHLGVDVLDVVNLRMPGFAEPVERSLAEPFEALAAAAAGGPDPAPRRQQRDDAELAEAAGDRPGRLRAEPLQPGAPATTTRWSTPSPARASPTCRSSRSAASPRSQSAALETVAAAAGDDADAGRADLAAGPLAQHAAHPRHVVGRATWSRTWRPPPGCSARSSCEELDRIGGTVAPEADL